MEKNQKSLWNNFLNMFQINPTNLSGALDIIVTQDEYGQFKSTKFHFRVGKFKAFNSDKKPIDLFINKKKSSFQMEFSDKGIAHFLIDNNNEEQSLFSETSEDNMNMAKRKSSFDQQEVNNFVKEQNRSQSINRQRKQSTYSSKDDTYLENQDQHHNIQDEEGKILLSLCGKYIKPKMKEQEINNVFDQNLVSYQKFDNDPQKVIQDPNLMIKIDSKIYESYIGIPQILSLLVYDKELTQFSLNKMAQIDFEQNFNLKYQKNFQPKKIEKFKTLKPPQEFWQELQLLEGENLLEFVFKGNLDNEYNFRSRIFYYPYKPYRRIIVSDIDGTITKSDILGHLMPFVSQDWSHDGIAKFYSDLYNRGYIVIYLTARNIGQAFKTLQYLQSIKQGEYKLPPGPLLTSPGSLFESIHQEIQVKKVENFKIKILRSIKNVFQYGQYNPLYAGFGNKETDAIAYSAAGVNIDYIFTITPDGKIYLLNSKEQYSYTKLSQLMEFYFPEYNPGALIENSYEDISYWNRKSVLKNLIPDIDDLIQDYNQFSYQIIYLNIIWKILNKHLHLLFMIIIKQTILLNNNFIYIFYYVYQDLFQVQFFIFQLKVYIIDYFQCHFYSVLVVYLLLYVVGYVQMIKIKFLEMLEQKD